MSQKEEQKSKIIEFQVLNQKVQQLQEHLQSINNNIQELQILRNSLDELENIKENQDILIPLGQGIFVKGIIKNNNELITNVGLNIMVEKDVKETKDMVKLNILNLSKVLENLEDEMNKNIEKLQGLQKEIVELAQLLVGNADHMVVRARFRVRLDGVLATHFLECGLD